VSGLSFNFVLYSAIVVYADIYLGAYLANSGLPECMVSFGHI